MCCNELRSIGQSQEKSSLFPYCPATLLMGPQEDAEIILFVASWSGRPVFPAGRNRAIHSRVPWPQVALPSWPHRSAPPTKSDCVKQETSKLISLFETSCTLSRRPVHGRRRVAS